MSAGRPGLILNVFLVTAQRLEPIRGRSGDNCQRTARNRSANADRCGDQRDTRQRGVIIPALAVLVIGAIAIFAMPTFWPVAIANSLMADCR